MIGEARALLAPFDAMIMPTTPAGAPTIAQVSESADAYKRWNLLMLRNTGLINMLDGCAASLPCQQPGELPVGLMVAGMGGSDQKVLAVARALEGALAPAEPKQPAGKRQRGA